MAKDEKGHGSEPKHNAFRVGEVHSAEVKKKNDAIMKAGVKRFLNPSPSQMKKDALDRKYRRRRKKK